MPVGAGTWRNGGRINLESHFMIKPRDAGRVNSKISAIQPTHDPLNGATLIEWFKYHDAVANRMVVQAAGYSNGIVCSDRTRAGKLHESNGFNIRHNLIESIIGRYHTFLIRITWKRSGRTIHDSTPIDTIYKFGEQQKRYDGLQWHLPLCHWSIDGQPATGPAPEPTPVAEQGALFAFDEPRRIGGY